MIKNKRLAIISIFALVSAISILIFMNKQPKQTEVLAECSYNLLSYVDGVEEQTITLDFSSCNSCQVNIPMAFGADGYQMKDLNDNQCVLSWGGEVENPDWNGEYKYRCRIDKNLGKMVFTVGLFGIDFSPIMEYCIAN